MSFWTGGQQLISVRDWGGQGVMSLSVQTLSQLQLLTHTTKVHWLCKFGSGLYTDTTFQIILQPHTAVLIIQPLRRS